MVDKVKLALGIGTAALSGAALFVAFGGAEAIRKAQVASLVAKGEIVEARTDLQPEEIKEIIETQLGGPVCLLLNREWNKAHRDGRHTAEARFLQQARDGGCPWVNQATDPHAVNIPGFGV